MVHVERLAVRLQDAGADPRKGLRTMTLPLEGGLELVVKG
jgi:hypothetical protein